MLKIKFRKFSNAIQKLKKKMNKLPQNAGCHSLLFPKITLTPILETSFCYTVHITTKFVFVYKGTNF